MINVLNEPDVYGDGIMNDQPGLQRLINAANNGGDGSFYFPPSRYRINSTLEFPDRHGYHLVGCGLPRPLPHGSSAQGAESTIIWGGANGGTMIKYQGVGLVWSGLGLWGCGLAGSSSSCPAARAGYGIRLEWKSQTAGTGKIWFDSILVAHCTNAIATGGAAINCDTLAFGNYWCHDCISALRLEHNQSLQYTFQMVRAVDVDYIFQVYQPPKPPGSQSFPETGGRIFTQTVAVETSGTTVLDLQGGGVNSAYHQIGGVVIDGSATGTILLNSVPPAGGSHHVRFTDGHFRGNPSITVDRFQGVGGTTSLELVGCRGVGTLQGAVTLKGKNPTNGRVVFFVRDCDLSGMTNTDVSNLIKSGVGNSLNYRAWAIDNWTFASGKIGDTSTANPMP